MSTDSTDATQPSHPLLSPSPPAFNLSQHQGLFKWFGSSHQVAKVLELHLQQQPFQWIFRVYFLRDGLASSPCSPRDSQESSLAPQFKGINSWCSMVQLYTTTQSQYIQYTDHICRQCAGRGEGWGTSLASFKNLNTVQEMYTCSMKKWRPVDT